MFSIPDLWLPILLSSIAVFIVSAILHTVIRPWHGKDAGKLPNEEAVAAAMRGTPPGEYRLPCPTDMRDAQSPEFAEKMKAGPVALIGVYKDPSVGKALGAWFVYTLFAGWIAGHTAHRALHVGADDYIVFHTVAMTAFAAYGVALAQASIWGPRPWWTTVKGMIDAVVFAVVTGAIFMWRWPM